MLFLRRFSIPLQLIGLCVGLSLLAPVVLSKDATKLSVPDGFIIETLPFSVPNARQLALTESGTLLVGTRREGKVYAVVGALSSKQPRVQVLFDDLTMPSGLALHDGALYIAAVSKILRVDNIEANLRRDPPTSVVVDDLPRARHHGWKYLTANDTGQLYVPVGAPCNICLSDDPRFAALLEVNAQTGKQTLIASGIRNIVGMAIHPDTGDLWVSNNGRDMLGDDIPADELNRVPANWLDSLEGAVPHYGYPFVHSNAANAPAGIIRDPKFGDHDKADGKTFVSAEQRIQAHSAPLGIAFYTGSTFPDEYNNALFVAEHGSWNRSSKVGYQISVMFPNQIGEARYRPFVTGWLNREKAWGRPNDVLVTPDGDLLIADDQAGKIFRVRFVGTAS